MNYDEYEQNEIFGMIEAAAATGEDIDWGRVSPFFNPGDFRLLSLALSTNHPYFFGIVGFRWRVGDNVYIPIIIPHVVNLGGFPVVRWHIELSYCEKGPDSGTGNGNVTMFRPENRDCDLTPWDM